MVTLFSLLSKDKEAYNLTLDQILEKEDYKKYIPLAKEITKSYWFTKRLDFRSQHELYRAIAIILQLFIYRYKAGQWYNSSKLNKKNYLRHKELAKKYQDWNTLLSGEVYIFRSPEYYSKNQYPKRLVEKFAKAKNKPLIFTALDMLYASGISYNRSMQAIDVLTYAGLIELKELGFTLFPLKKETRNKMMECHKVINNEDYPSEQKADAHIRYLYLQDKKDYSRGAYQASSYVMKPIEEWNLHNIIKNAEDYIYWANLIHSDKRRKTVNPKQEQIKKAKELGAIVRNKSFNSNLDPLQSNEKSDNYYELPAPDKYQKEIQKINSKIEKRYLLLSDNLKYHRVFVTRKEDDPDLLESDVKEYGRLYNDFNSSMPKIIKQNLIKYYNYAEIDYDNFNLNYFFLKITGKKYEGDIYLDFLSSLDLKMSLTEDERNYYRKFFSKKAVIQATNIHRKDQYTKKMGKMIDSLGLHKITPIYAFTFPIIEKHFHKNERQRNFYIKKEILEAYNDLYIGNPAKKAKILDNKSEDNINTFIKRAINHYKYEFITKKKRFEEQVINNGYDPSKIRRINTNPSRIVKSIETVLKPIKSILYRESAGICQRIESECTLSLIKSMLRDKVLPLSIHDAILVPNYLKNKYEEKKERVLQSKIDNEELILKIKNSNQSLNPFKRKFELLKSKYKKNKEIDINRIVREKDKGLLKIPDIPDLSLS